MYMIPTQRRSMSPQEEERRKGLCHLCKEHGHIQCQCPRKTPESPARMASTKTTPLVSNQGVKQPQSPTINHNDVLRYLKRMTPENQNEVAARLMKSVTHQDFSLA